MTLYIILSYDARADRTQIYKKIAGRFLQHTHYSVFEGHVTESQFMKLCSYIEKEVKVDESLVIWTFETKSQFKKIVFGYQEEFNII